MSLQALKDTIKSYCPVEPNWDLLEKAYWFAVKAHQGQKHFPANFILLILWVWPIFWPS